MRRTLAAFIFVVAPVAALPASAANTAHFTLVSPADLSVLPQGATSVTLVFQVDWAGVKATYGDTAKVGLSIGFPCCTSDAPLGAWLAPGTTSQTFTVAEILQAMAAKNTPPDSAVKWILNTHKGLDLVENASAQFFVKPPHRPGPRYTPSLAPDSPTAWPTTFVVTNDGDGFSRPSSLAVSVKLLSSRFPVPRGACEPRFSDFARDVPVLAPGGKFDVPPIELHVGPLAGKLPLPTPATTATATPPPSRLTSRIACRFEIKAATGPPSRTNAPRPVGVYGSLTRTITIEEPAP